MGYLSLLNERGALASGEGDRQIQDALPCEVDIDLEQGRRCDESQWSDFWRTFVIQGKAAAPMALVSFRQQTRLRWLGIYSRRKLH